MTDQLTQHRDAYQVVMDLMPGSQWASHSDVLNPDWQMSDICMPGWTGGCQVCGFDLAGPGFTSRCKPQHQPPPKEK